MSGFNCDLCGKPLLVDEDVRYIVKIEVFAAYDPMELTSDDLRPDRTKEISQLARRMADMDPEELEAQVYKNFQFDLCPKCQKLYLKDPLRKSDGA